MNNWKVNTMKEASQERNPMQYVVSGLIERPSVNVVYGEPDSLKTMLLLDMSACVVKGLPWLRNSEGVETKPTTKLGVLWLDLDNGVRRTHDHVQAIGNHYGLTESDSFYYVSMPAGGLDMADPVSVVSLMKAISPDVGLVVIDNLNCLLGKADRNLSEMARVVSSFRTLAEQYQLAVVLLYTVDTGLDYQRARTGVDLALYVDRRGADDFVIIRPRKTRGNQIAEFGARFLLESDETSLRQAWFDGKDADDIEIMWEYDVMQEDAMIRSSGIFVLLYKPGFMDICPIEAYVYGERSMLERDPSYKREWVPIAYGGYALMHKQKHEIEKNGLGNARSWWIESL